MSNCLLSAAGVGDYLVTCLTISHGVRVISGSPDSARDHRAFYLSKRTAARFTLGLTFASQRDYANFGAWLQHYGHELTKVGSSTGRMRVRVPARNFDRVGVPVSGGSYGDQVGQITYPVTLQFDGGNESRDFANAAPSSFVLATSDAAEGKFFYPAATQLKGFESAEDSLYGLPGGTTKILNLFKNLFGGGDRTHITPSDGNTIMGD